MEQAWIPLVKQHGLDGKMSEHQVAALYGLCQREIIKELRIAKDLLDQSLAKEALVAVYTRERARDVASVMAAVDSSFSRVDIGSLQNVEVVPAMWDVV